MRCPKCGFHSFDYLDNCKKCGVDLTEQKLRLKFQGYVAPAPVVNIPAPAVQLEPPELPERAEAEEEAIDFGFDVLEGEAMPPLADFANDDGEADRDFGDFAAIDPAAIDPIDVAADSGLNLDQPFPAESENLPDDDLPKLDDRFGF